MIGLPGSPDVVELRGAGCDSVAMLINRFWKDHRNELILSDASSGPDQCLQIVGAFDTGRRFDRVPQELVKCKAGMFTCICDSKSGYQLQCGHVELQVSAIFA